MKRSSHPATGRAANVRHTPHTTRTRRHPDRRLGCRLAPRPGPRAIAMHLVGLNPSEAPPTHPRAPRAKGAPNGGFPPSNQALRSSGQHGAAMGQLSLRSQTLRVDASALLLREVVRLERRCFNRGRVGGVAHAHAAGQTVDRFACTHARTCTHKHTHTQRSPILALGQALSLGHTAPP